MHMHLCTWIHASRDRRPSSVISRLNAYFHGMSICVYTLWNKPKLTCRCSVAARYVHTETQELIALQADKMCISTDCLICYNYMHTFSKLHVYASLHLNICIKGHKLNVSCIHTWIENCEQRKKPPCWKI